MEYSTLQGKIIIPEYGRNVQRMVEYALTIEDKTQRERCVEAIMQTMCNLFPYLRDEAQRHKMYDHLAIMSDFRLDIDFPYERPEPDELRYHPHHLSYAAAPVRMRHYGRMVEQMIQVAIRQTDPEKREALTLLIANRMKRNYLLCNKDLTDDQVIADDLRRLSDDQLTIEPQKLAKAKNLLQQNVEQNKKKDKKKKNNK